MRPLHALCWGGPRDRGLGRACAAVAGASQRHLPCPGPPATDRRFYVASGKDRDLYAMLVGMGADETIPDSSGTTARAKAIQNGLVDA